MNRHLTLAVCVLTLPLVAGDTAVAPAATLKAKANYELAARWTAAKVGKMVFDMAVTPHWLDTGDRFWYSFENSKGAGSISSIRRRRRRRWSSIR